MDNEMQERMRESLEIAHMNDAERAVERRIYKQALRTGAMTALFCLVSALLIEPVLNISHPIVEMTGLAIISWVLASYIEMRYRTARVLIDDLFRKGKPRFGYDAENSRYVDNG